MSSALKDACAAVVAVIVQAACLWVLARVVEWHLFAHVVALPYSLAFALAFAAGCLTLIACRRILAPPGDNASSCNQIRAYGLFGVAALLVGEVILYLGIDLFGLNLWIANAAALAVIVCWVAFGWRFVWGDA